MESHQHSQEPEWKSFDWWRSELNAKYGRPPSPFPASFETPRQRPNGSADLVPVSNGEKGQIDESDRLTWPICSGPDTNQTCNNISNAKKLKNGLNKRSKKMESLVMKKQPWIPPSNRSKNEAIFHPPPYTNRCKETIFGTKDVPAVKIPKARQV
ncbi:hypothetical protein RRG08_048820 [Elysia crispata]|uniref:Uncharacterized protein n=1 Tax=Elysia crispata TaxID=231223 RepID=A0AAE1B462_9GAST|nr:hypothetical protein RRG08_048820 [Elysia crispata]